MLEAKCVTCGNTKEYHPYKLNCNSCNAPRARNKNYKEKYNISLEDYEDMLIEQLGVCAICNKRETVQDHRTNKARRLAVDHCHKTGKVRGLLCSSCNLILGKAHDDISILSKAITYLSKYNE